MRYVGPYAGIVLNALSGDNGEPKPKESPDVEAGSARAGRVEARRRRRRVHLGKQVGEVRAQ